jgi:hypothetical protein
MKKKVIFVGGTAHSGTTLVTMVLSNDLRGFACGEPQNFLYPTRPFHNQLSCSCGDPNCRVWRDVKQFGKDNMYEYIFDRYPDVEFIVDSSKNPFWIRSKVNFLAQKGISTRNILVWKSPMGIADSYKRRGKFDRWERSWVNYTRLYSSVIDDWRAINLKDFIRDEKVLERICEYLGIRYFHNKKEYWNKEHHVIGGSHSAKIHLYQEGTSQYENSKQKHQVNQYNPKIDTHKTIYDQSADDQVLTEQINDRIKSSRYIRGILSMLESRDICEGDSSVHGTAGVRFSPFSIILRRIKYLSRLWVGGFRYESEN